MITRRTHPLHTAHNGALAAARTVGVRLRRTPATLTADEVDLIEAKLDIFLAQVDRLVPAARRGDVRAVDELAARFRCVLGPGVKPT